MKERNRIGREELSEFLENKHKIKKEEELTTKVSLKDAKI